MARSFTTGLLVPFMNPMKNANAAMGVKPARLDKASLAAVESGLRREVANRAHAILKAPGLVVSLPAGTSLFTRDY